MSEDSQELDLELSRTARLIRRHCDAFLRFDEHFQPVRYCRATDGRLIIPAMAAMQMAEELVLHVPDATDQSLQLMVTGEPLPTTIPSAAKRTDGASTLASPMTCNGWLLNLIWANAMDWSSMVKRSKSPMPSPSKNPRC